MIRKIFALVLVLCLTLCACGGPANEQKTATDIGFSKHSTKPKEKVLTDSVSMWSAWRDGALRPFARPNGNAQFSFDWLNEKLPIQCLRTPTADTAYALYKSDSGGYLYIFFTNEGSHYAYSHWAYMEKRLSMADFAQIELDDLRNEVLMIDHGCRTVVQSAEGYESLIRWSPNIPNTESQTFHILEDGLLVIRYDEGGRVKQINFRKDYIYTVKVGDVKKDYNFTIFAEDFANPPMATDTENSTTI